MRKKAKKQSPTEGIQKMIDKNQTELITAATSLTEILKISEKRVRYLVNKVNNPVNNPLMVLLAEKKLLPIHYVYMHVSPDGEIEYIGKGSGGRAYEDTLRRGSAHSLWMVKQQFNQHKFIQMVGEALTEEEAARLESQLIKKHGTPFFNKTFQ